MMNKKTVSQLVIHKSQNLAAVFVLRKVRDPLASCLELQRVQLRHNVMLAQACSRTSKGDRGLPETRRMFRQHRAERLCLWPIADERPQGTVARAAREAR